jgi:hypothetical protein
MAAYPNTLAITAANGLVNGRDHLNVTPVLKAVVRDLKKYLVCSSKIRGTRILPVGYASAHGQDINQNPGLLEYLYYGDKENTIDFWAVSHFDNLGAGFKILTTHIVCQLWLDWEVEHPDFRLDRAGMFFFCWSRLMVRRSCANHTSGQSI